MNTKKSLGYLADIEDAYLKYIALKPLDLAGRDQDDPAVIYWRKNIQYDISEFSRQLYYLQAAGTIDEFMRKSYADFDNSAIVIQAALESDMVKLIDGKIIPGTNIKHYTPLKFAIKDGFEPNSDYNQFPCDNESVVARVEFLQQRYPSVEHINFGLIGDDDFVSIELARLPQFNVKVVEKDERIISRINERQNPGIDVEDFDIVNVFSQEAPRMLQSFMTDPPYTVHGSLAFIYCGLARMHPRSNNSAEFYVILNQTMMGQNLHKILKVLSAAGIYLKGVGANFSQYRLPAQFSERRRADKFLTSIGVSDPQILGYSSSSNIYTFELSQDFNIQILKDFIEPDKMYEHYAD